MATIDLRSLSSALKVLLILQGLAVLLSLWSDSVQLELLERIARGGEFTPEEADDNDARQFLVGMVALGVILPCGIVFLRWLYLASRNVHEETQGMRFTPGWTVGWYFVPVLNLWKPYQAMVELFRASNPDAQPGRAWQDASRPAFLPLWWMLWIVAHAANNAVLRGIFRADTAEELVRYNQASLFAGVLDLMLVGMGILLVTRLSSWQHAKFLSGRA